MKCQAFQKSRFGQVEKTKSFSPCPLRLRGKFIRRVIKISSPNDRNKMSNQTTNTLAQTKPAKGDEKAPALMVPIFKLPILLYQLHLGWLLGKRFMQITHVGRRSGKVRKSILAVLRFDEKTKEIYAVSAWRGSDW